MCVLVCSSVGAAGSWCCSRWCTCCAVRLTLPCLSTVHAAVAVGLLLMLLLLLLLLLLLRVGHQSGVDNSSNNDNNNNSSVH